MKFTTKYFPPTMPSTDSYQNILVVELIGGLGDLLLALPAIHALAFRHPNAKLRVLTYQPGAQLLLTDPTVSEVVWPDGPRQEDAHTAVARELERQRPDLVVSTTCYAEIPSLIEASGAKRWVTNLWRKPPPDQLVGQRYLQILAAEGLLEDDFKEPPLQIHLTEPELIAGEQAITEHLPQSSSAPPIVLVPTAGMKVKYWPWQRWRELTSVLTQQGIPVLVAAERLEQKIPGTTWLPPADLRGLASQFAAIGRYGGIVIGPDTGPVRMATAVGTRAVCLFGPSSAARYGLNPRLAINLQGLPSCPYRQPTLITEQICWWDANCPLSSLEPACMADLDVPEVLTALSSFIKLTNNLKLAAYVL